MYVWILWIWEGKLWQKGFLKDIHYTSTYRKDNVSISNRKIRWDEIIQSVFIGQADKDRERENVVKKLPQTNIQPVRNKIREIQGKSQFNNSISKKVE